MSFEERYKNLIGTSTSGIGSLPTFQPLTTAQEAQRENMITEFYQDYLDRNPVKDPGTFAEFAPKYMETLETMYDMPKARTTGQIISELEPLVGTQQQNKDQALALALSRFGRAIGQTPGMNTLQAFTASLPAFTETMIEENRKNSERRARLALTARQESKAEEKELRALQNQLAGQAVTQYNLKLKENIDNKRDALKDSLKRVNDLTKGMYDPAEYDFFAAYDNNAIGGNKIRSQGEMAINKKDGSVHVKIDDQWYTDDELSKYGFNYVPDRSNALAANELKNLDSDLVSSIFKKGTPTKITVENADGSFSTDEVFNYKGLLAKRDPNNADNVILIDRNEVGLGTVEDNLKEIEKDKFVTVLEAQQNIGDTKQGERIYRTGDSAKPFQRTYDDGQPVENILQEDDLFVTVAEKNSQTNLRTTDKEGRNIAFLKANQNRKLLELIAEVAGDPTNFKNADKNVFGFSNVLKRSGPTKALAFAAGLFGSDKFDYELSDLGKRNVTKIQRLLATAWAENPRFAIAERTALIGIVNGAAEGAPRDEVVDQYFQREVNSIGGLLQIAVTTRNNIEFYSSFFREADEPRLKYHRVPSGSSTFPFTVDGKLQGNKFGAATKLDSDTIKFLQEMERNAESPADKARVNGMHIQLSPQFYQSIVKEKYGREIIMPADPYSLTYGELKAFLQGTSQPSINPTVANLKSRSLPRGR